MMKISEVALKVIVAWVVIVLVAIGIQISSDASFEKGKNYVLENYCGGINESLLPEPFRNATLYDCSDKIVLKGLAERPLVLEHGDTLNVRENGTITKYVVRSLTIFQISEVDDNNLE